jgi:hypothetical protein
MDVSKVVFHPLPKKVIKFYFLSMLQNNDWPGQVVRGCCCRIRRPLRRRRAWVCDEALYPLYVNFFGRHTWLSNNRLECLNMSFTSTPRLIFAGKSDRLFAKLSGKEEWEKATHVAP